MKIAVIDSACLYNDMLYVLLSKPDSLITIADNSHVYVGKPMHYEQILHDLHKYVYKFYGTDYIALHVMLSTTTPVLLQSDIVLPNNRMHDHIVKALRHALSSSYTPISVHMHEYGDFKARTDIISNLCSMIGSVNCDFIPCQEPIILRRQLP